MKKVAGSFVAAVVVVLFLAGCGDNGKDQKKDEHKGHGAAAPAAPAKITQKTCPIMGRKIDPKLFADHKGRRVYFCCKMCIGKFEKDPEEYIKKLDAGAAKPATG